MAVRTDAAHEEINASSFLNHLLIVGTLCLEILGVAVEDVYVLLLDVDMREEVCPHE